MKKSVFTIIICVCMALVFTVGCSHLSDDVKEQPKNPQFILANNNSEEFSTLTNRYGTYCISTKYGVTEVYLNLVDIEASNVVVDYLWGNASFEIISNSQLKVNIGLCDSRLVLEDTVSGVNVEIKAPWAITKEP